MEILQKQYAELLAGQQFREEDLDPAVLARHIAALSSSALLAGCAVSIFDLHRCEHAYESEFHRALFSDPQQEYAGVRIHPEDLVQVAGTAWQACATSFCAGIRIWMSGVSN